MRATCRWPIDVTPAVFEQKGKEFVKRKKVKLDSRAKVKKFEQEKVRSICIMGVGNVLSIGFPRRLTVRSRVH